MKNERATDGPSQGEAEPDLVGGGSRRPASAATPSRGEAVALIRIAALDAALARSQPSLDEVLLLLQRQQVDVDRLVDRLAALIKADRARIENAPGNGEDSGETRRRLEKNVEAHLEAAERLERARTDALKRADELQGRTAALEERRQALIAGTSLSLRDRYEGALRAGLRPAVVPIHQAACSGCGEPLTETARRSVMEAVQIVSCSGCGRLVYDQGWVERDFMAPSLRPVQQTDT